MDVLELLKNLGAVSSPLLALGGFYFGRARRAAETESINQKNIDSEFKRINNALDQLEERNREQHAENREQAKEIKALREEVWQLRIENAVLRGRLGLVPDAPASIPPASPDDKTK